MSSKKHSHLIIFLIVCIDLLGFAIVLPLLPYYGVYYHASKLEIGMLMASFSAMQFLFAPIWGRVSDRIGRRPILLLGLVGSTTCYAGFGWVSQFPADALIIGITPLTWLFITRLGAGVAGATISTAQAYMSDTTTKQERGKGMVLIGIAFGIGFSFGPLIAAPFVSDNPLDPPSSWPGYVAAALSGFALLFAIFRLPESLHKYSVPTGRNWFNLKELRYAVTQPSILITLITIFIATFAFAQFETTLPYLMKEMGFSARSNTYVFAYIGFTLLLFQGGLIRRLIPKLGEYKMGIMGAVCLAVGLLMIGSVLEQKSFAVILMVLPVSVLGFSAVSPALQAMLSLGSNASDQGSVLGVGQSVSSLARIFGPVAGYLMLDISLTLPYWSGAVLMLLTAFLISKIDIPGTKRSKSKQENSVEENVNPQPETE
ncbi:MAG: MFS transporter [Planctomycetaceae bacterium]|nr:MFS transporter [Planctomycetaceae bacterium]